MAFFALYFHWTGTFSIIKQYQRRTKDQTKSNDRQDKTTQNLHVSYVFRNEMAKKKQSQTKTTTTKSFSLIRRSCWCECHQSSQINRCLRFKNRTFIERTNTIPFYFCVFVGLILFSFIKIKPAPYNVYLSWNFVCRSKNCDNNKPSQQLQFILPILVWSFLSFSNSHETLSEKAKKKKCYAFGSLCIPNCKEEIKNKNLINTWVNKHIALLILIDVRRKPSVKTHTYTLTSFYCLIWSILVRYNFFSFCVHFIVVDRF